MGTALKSGGKLEIDGVNDLNDQRSPACHCIGEKLKKKKKTNRMDELFTKRPMHLELFFSYQLHSLITF